MKILSLWIAVAVAGWIPSPVRADVKADEETCDRLIGKFLGLQSKADEDIMASVSRGKNACMEVVESLQATDLRIPAECQQIRLSRLQTRNAKELAPYAKRLDNPSVFDALAAARAGMISSKRFQCGDDSPGLAGGAKDREECRWTVGTYLKWRNRMTAVISQSEVERKSCHHRLEKLRYQGYFVPEVCIDMKVTDLGSELQDAVVGATSDESERNLQIQSTDSIPKAMDKLRGQHYKMLRIHCDRLRSFN